jgi:hypothetical protein
MYIKRKKFPGGVMKLNYLLKNGINTLNNLRELLTLKLMNCSLKSNMKPDTRSEKRKNNAGMNSVNRLMEEHPLAQYLVK